MIDSTVLSPQSRVYVAGHRGLVGSAITRRLRADGLKHQASPGAPGIITRTHAELDLTDQHAVEQFFQQEQPEYVFLAAARVGGIHANNTYPADFIRDNLAIQTNIIHSAYRHKARRLLFLGSSCIYPRDCPQPIKEEYLLTGPLEPTNRPYALAKIAGIEMCWSYNRQYGTQYLAAMPTNLYGPGDNYHLENSHVIPAMIRKFHLAKLAQQGDLAGIMHDEAVHGRIPADIKTMIGVVADSPITQSSVVSPQSSVLLWGSGTPRREFLYNEDMADACVFLMKLPDARFQPLLAADRNDGLPPVVNVGVGTDVTIKELAELVKQVVGYQGEVSFDTSQPDGTMRKVMDVSKINALGWRDNTEIKIGIGKAYASFLSELSW